MYIYKIDKIVDNNFISIFKDKAQHVVHNAVRCRTGIFVISKDDEQAFTAIAIELIKEVLTAPLYLALDVEYEEVLDQIIDNIDKLDVIVSKTPIEEKENIIQYSSPLEEKEFITFTLNKRYIS